jgi:hypothetical protein
VNGKRADKIMQMEKRVENLFLEYKATIAAMKAVEQSSPQAAGIYQVEAHILQKQINDLRTEIEKVNDNPSLVKAFGEAGEQALRDHFGTDGVTALDVVDTPNSEYLVPDNTYYGDVEARAIRVGKVKTYTVTFQQFVIYGRQVLLHYRRGKNVLYCRKDSLQYR